MSNNPTPTNYYNDQISLRIGKRLKVVADELRAQGHGVPADLDIFLDVQERYGATVEMYEGLHKLVREQAIQRKASRATLLEAEHVAWDLVPTVGISARRKPAMQVEQEYQLLFPSGRPGATSPGDLDLIKATDELVSELTNDSDLARAWPPDNLHAISEARDAFVPAYEAWQQTVVRRSLLLSELELLRSEWFEALGLLRDQVKRAMRLNRRPNRFAALFRHRRPTRPQVVEEEQSPPPPPDPSPENP